MGTTMFDAPIKLKFSYTLRSFNFVNPRVAFLDLMTNILSLMRLNGIMDICT